MLAKHTLFIALAAALSTATAIADSVPDFYAVTLSQQFGVVSGSNGSFLPNTGTPEGDVGLVNGPGGSLLTLTVSGNLDSINPATGASTVVGATGLGDCSFPSSPCGPTSANVIGQLNGKLYATDFANDLYSVNPSTGAATLIGPTGMPGVPAIPGSTNVDGSINVYGATLFGDNGSLYSTFDAIKLSADGSSFTPVVAPELYRIDPLTGLATPIASTSPNLLGATDVNGTVYVFNAFLGQLDTLNVKTGATTFVENVQANGPICGADPVPEPGTFVLAGLGLLAVGALCRRRLGNAD